MSLFVVWRACGGWDLMIKAWICWRDLRSGTVWRRSEGDGFSVLGSGVSEISRTAAGGTAIAIFFFFPRSNSKRRKRISNQSTATAVGGARFGRSRWA